jgi:hypothetical protein
MGRRGFIEDKVLVGLEAGTLARIKLVILKGMSRGAFIRQAIEHEIVWHETLYRHMKNRKRKPINDLLYKRQFNPTKF